MTRPLLRVLLLTVPALALAACSPDQPVAARPSDSAPAAPAVTPSASSAPSASSKPTAPFPADGKNVRACRDGRCEVRVAARSTVPLPARSGLGAAEVVAIDAGTVTLVIPLTGSKFDSDGGCSTFITGPSGGAPGYATLSCAEGDRGTVNKISVEVIDITGKAAILRVRPS